MRYLGRITDWNDDKGFGFVTPNGGGDRAFVHVKAFERQGRRPVSGDLIAYAVQRDAKGRLNASAVRFAGAHAKREPAPRRQLPRKAIAGLASPRCSRAGCCTSCRSKWCSSAWS